MKFALPLLVTAAVFASGVAHATPYCKSETKYSGATYYNGMQIIPIWHRGRDTGCLWKFVGYRRSLDTRVVSTKRQ